MNDPKQILFIASRADIAGGEVYLLNVMRHLDRERFAPFVVLPRLGEFSAALNRDGIENAVVESEYGWVGAPLAWYRLVEGLDARVRRVREIIRERNVELVHTNSNMILEGALAACLEGVHHVYLAHIEFQPNMPIFERFSIDQASFAHLMGDLSTRVVAVSKSVADALVPPIAKEKVQVIHNGLELKEFESTSATRNGDLRHELGLPADSILVTSIGRIHPDKGHDDLVRCASKVVGQTNNVHFLHAGEDDDKPFADQLRADVRVAGIDNRFHFLGYRRDVPHLLAESDIFVLSSRREGHPFVLLEAMASGCASVATRCGGVEDTVTNGKTGLVVSIGDTAEMTEAVVRLANDTVLRTAIASAAREDLRARFDVKTSVAALMNVYDEVLRSPKPMSGSVGVDLFLRATNELGTLGLKVTEMEERLRQVEHLAQHVRDNLIYKAARRLKQGFRSRRDTV
jgi:glycosyltransferase involved in cell wall biosynthesis